MEYFAGLDVATEETAICLIDGAGSIVLEATVATEPEAICKALRKHLPRLRRVGHEAGSLSPWLQTELTKLGLPAVCLEARHTRAALAAQRNKTDRADARGIAHIMRTGWFRQVHVKSRDSYRLRLLLNQRNKTDRADARGIAHIMRTGWFRQVHVKSRDSYRLRLLLNQRSNLKRKFLDIENAIRHSIKAFGIKVGLVSRGQFEARVRDLVADDPLIAGLTDCMLRARAALWQEYLRLHQVVVAMVARDETCARFMRIPGVGPISALAFKTAVDDPRRFRGSRTVGAYLGLTSRRWQSGASIDIQGHISKAGDKDVRRVLYEAANLMLTRFKGWSALKVWGLKIAARRGHKRACVAVARKLAVIMHAMWRDGSEFRFKADAAAKKHHRRKAQMLAAAVA